MNYPVMNVTQFEGQLSTYHLNGGSMTTPQSEEEEKNIPSKICCIYIRNRPEWVFGCWTGSFRISIYYPVSRILPDQNWCLEGKI